jgi:hypothetical protein
MNSSTVLRIASFGLCWVFAGQTVFAQKKDIEKSLELYAIEAKAAKPDYFVRQVVHSETIDNVELIFQAEAELIKFVSGKVEYGSYGSNVTFLDNEPEVTYTELKAPGSNRSYGPVAAQSMPAPFAERNSYEYLDIGTLQLEPVDASRTSYRRVNPATGHGLMCKPFDPMAWPLIHQVHLRRFGEFQKDLLELVREDMQCISEEKDGKRLKGEWQQKHGPGWAGFHSVTLTFENDLIVEAKWEEVDVRNKSRKVHSEVKTKWGEKQGESVPIEVEAIVSSLNRKVGMIRWNVKLEWSLPGDPVFEEVKKQVDPLVEAVKKAYPERAIAGAEAPKPSRPAK